MVGKIVLLPFRLLGTSTGLVFGILKFLFSFSFGIIKFVFKNSIGVILGLVAGVFIAKKQFDTDCNCGESNKEEPIE
jgi:hypothetical protein